MYPGLPLSLLRLLVPPLQLRWAAMWQLAKQKDVMNYHKLQEFVHTLTDALPGIMTQKETAQLILGLRARLILELCKGSVRGCVDSQKIQAHLENLPLTSDHGDAEVKAAESTFVALVQSLLKDPAERAYFFQEVFPVEYGAKYDAALHVLLWELLSKLEKLLPIPDLEQTAAWLGSGPALLDECVQSTREELGLIFQHCQNAALFKMPHGNPTSLGGCIMSALSIPPSHKANLSVAPELVHNYASILDPEQYSVVTVYTEVEVGASEAAAVAADVQTCFYEEEVTPQETVEVARALETLTKTFAVRKESLENDDAASEDQEDGVLAALGNDVQPGDVRSDAAGEGEMTHAATELPPVRQTPSNEAAASCVIAVKGSDKGDSDETTSIIFSCSECPFHHSEDDSPPHFHMQSVPTEEYRKLSGAKVPPTPCITDEIFTSIKLFPQGGAAQPEGAPVKEDRVSRLTCPTCGRTFTRTSDVRRHQLTHTGERPFRCRQCERTFQHSWDLAKHRSKSHAAAVSFACPPCRATFANLRALTAHHKRSHSGEGRLPHICSICSRSFASAGELLEHRTSHVAAKRYVCLQCGEGFDSLLARSLHRQTHQVKRQFKCPHCDKTYTRRSDVKRHLATHTGERPHKCGHCNKRFSLRFMLVQHLRVHTGERPFQCLHCDKTFTLASVLARHERMHTGEKPFLCSQCGKTFLSQGELSKHHRSHVDDKPYACPQCHKRFKSKKTQQEHVISHTGVRPYPCAYCGKGFAKPYALTRHHLIHTGERPFPCSYCDKTFLTPGEAQLHQRVHTGEKPYSCDACRLRFKSSSELAWHKRSHAGVKPPRPSCGKCRKNFPSKAKLEKHMETHDEEGQAAE
uniref:zinc finger and SCAN domain-containing protein 2 isoform X2 n=1 Tax=Doryrhamphus excisus TaxID=161450 RepID=UPI0025AE177B|nr:zinc finger and SCAN domain-containing protein 2 isoform X2 [Doryrhamphus excisus]